MYEMSQAIQTAFERECAAVLEIDCDVVVVEQVETVDGEVFRASAGWTCELYMSRHGARVVASNHRQTFVFGRNDLKHAGGETPTTAELLAADSLAYEVAA